jgi:hypothetical protein
MKKYTLGGVNMIDKIKAFFANKKVKAVALMLFVVSLGALLIGGIAAETLSGGIVLVGAILTAVGALILWINSLLK